jgi:hypothetical protein
MRVNKLLNLGTGVEATRWWGEDKELTSAEKEKREKGKGATEVICLDDLSADMESIVLSSF